MSLSIDTQFNIQIGNDLTWNVKPLLHEIKHSLKNLMDNGESAIIDLRSIPLAPGEEDKILSTLGEGEVIATLSTLGISTIMETRFTGVWVVTHFNDEENIVSRFIEITTMPDILKSQQEDISAAYENITSYLEEEYNN